MSPKTQPVVQSPAENSLREKVRSQTATATIPVNVMLKLALKPATHRASATPSTRNARIPADTRPSTKSRAQPQVLSPQTPTRAWSTQTSSSQGHREANKAIRVVWLILRLPPAALSFHASRIPHHAFYGSS